MFSVWPLLRLTQPPGRPFVLVQHLGEQLASPLLTLRGHFREPAIRRIDDDGRAVLSVQHDGPLTRIHPEGVIAANVPRRAARAVAAGRRRTSIRVAHLVLRRPERSHLRGRPLRQLLRQDQRGAELLRPLQRGDRRDVVGAGQVGLAVRRARDVGADRRR
jgi:hypothetical protein